MSDNSLLASSGSTCRLCGGDALLLPSPTDGRAVLSDGQIVGQTLKRLSCLQCGDASHSADISTVEVRSFYATDYKLTVASTESDAGRAQSYAAWIEAEVPRPRTILEVGCGSGALLRELSNRWPGVEYAGIDAALPVLRADSARFRLERGFIEDMPADAGRFDLIIAINVIEHIVDPARFMAALKDRLLPGGRIVIVCPVADPPNVELLFYDHLHSFTPHALHKMTGSAFETSRSVPAPDSIGDFQMMVFGEDRPAPFGMSAKNAFLDLAIARRDYLMNWANLDSTLLLRLGSATRCVAFGGGQGAALLRAYAPHIWARVGHLALDNVDEAWSLDKPVIPYRETVESLKGAAIIVATAPRSQKRLASRLQADGLHPICYDDLITR